MPEKNKNITNEPYKNYAMTIAQFFIGVVNTLLNQIVLRLFNEQIIVRLDSYSYRQRLSGINEKALFLDCGSNLGQGFRFFKKHFPLDKFDYELFEPNPNCIAVLKKYLSGIPEKNILLHEKAVSTTNETLKFYGTAENEGGKFSVGGSINPEHNSKYYETSDTTALSVPAIDFSAYLAEKSKTYKTILVKMDIEGAENDVLEKIIADNTIAHIDTLYVEFHAQYLKLHERKPAGLREQKIKCIIKDKGKPILRIWH